MLAVARDFLIHGILLAFDWQLYLKTDVDLIIGLVYQQRMLCNGNMPNYYAYAYPLSTHTDTLPSHPRQE